MASLDFWATAVRGVRRAAWMGAWVAAAGVAIACNALDEPPPKDGKRLVVPTDDRPAVQALTSPPPISGGTLALDRTALIAVVADPDRDRISLVSLSDGEPTHVALEAGDEPGRVALDDSGRAHVALRGTGEVVSLAVDSGELLARRRACRAARGMAFDAELDALHVACAEGKIVTLAADPDAGEAPLRSLDVPDGVRDVVLQPDGSLMVSHFKRAELLHVDPDGEILSRRQPRDLLHGHERFEADGRVTVTERTLQPHVAYRLQGLPPAAPGQPVSVAMLHQGSMLEEVDLDVDADSPEQSAYGGGGIGGLFSCGGIVSTELSVAGPQGEIETYALAAGLMPVDLAVSSSGRSLAVVQAGAPDLEAPRPFVVQESEDGFGSSGGAVDFAGPGFEGSHSVIVFQRDEFPLGDAAAPSPQDGREPLDCRGGPTFPVDGQPTAVVFVNERQLLVQSREPASLTLIDLQQNNNRMIELGGDSMADTGHELFHRDTGAGIACASCHAEGGDDGHVWTFSGIGSRRTQAVHVGLEGTAPFHWDGDMRDLDMLMGEVFVGRMGGVHQSPERMERMHDWLFGLQPPPAMVATDDEAARRGEALFHSAEVGCASCHAGSKMTDNNSYHVGTTDGDHPLQVPSLRGIAYRSPFLHDGCADTLRARFDDADCGGGDMHGKTSQLSAGEIDDLVMYLKTR